MAQGKAPSNEDGIVWTEDVTDVDYVREDCIRVDNRRRFIEYWGMGRTVGYSTLPPDVESDDTGQFRRRVFWLHPGDRADDPYGPYAVHTPMEAVDPRTVAPGVPGRHTERSIIPEGSPRWRQVMRKCALADWRKARSRAAYENAEMAAHLKGVEVIAIDDHLLTLGCPDAATVNWLKAEPNLELLQVALRRFAWKWRLRFVVQNGEQPAGSRPASEDKPVRQPAQRRNS